MVTVTVPLVPPPIMPLPAVTPVIVPVPTLMEQLLPSVQGCPLTVVEVFASALFGIGDAVTASDGADVGFVTVGTSHNGQLPDGAAKLVTVPLPMTPTCT